MNLIQAFVRNVGTCRFDVKGEIQVEIRYIINKHADHLSISVGMKGWKVSETNPTYVFTIETGKISQFEAIFNTFLAVQLYQ